MRILDVTTSIATSLLRGASGARIGALGARPERPLELYEFENCPFCRKVREALSILDLEVDVKPCPKRGLRYRPFVKEQTGKEQFPYLVDSNTGKALLESDEIVTYLFSQYGDGRVPTSLALGPLTDVSAVVAGLMRGAGGAFVRPSRAPERPLELYSYEASPFCRIVREALCALEIPYRLHNVARGSATREAFVRRSGKQLVPYLVDPNTDVEMFESADIVAYLEETYAGGSGP